MPKRKVVEQEFSEALAAIREAFQHPYFLTPDEERDFLERRAKSMYIERHEYIVTVRCGKIVYREHGRAGADLPAPPYWMHTLKRMRDFATELAKIERSGTARSLAQARKIKAEKRAEKIRELAKQFIGNSMEKRVARVVGCSVRTVQRALGKNTP